MKQFLKIAALLACLIVPSVADAAVGFVYIDTGGCESLSTTKCSGSTDSASASAKGAGSTVTCSATSGPGSTPGCIITGTNTAVGQLGSIATDGSQSLFMNCATNSNQKIFWINAVDNGTGAVGTTVTPTGCTAATSDWGIGGRMIYASANIEAAVRAGDTIQFNNSPASKSSTFFTARVAGDETTGKINIIGKTGSRPVLATTGNVIVLQMNDQPNYYITNLELNASGNQTLISSPVGGTVIENVKIAGTGGSASQHGIAPDGVGVVAINNDISVGGAGIITSYLMHAVGNYIHGCGASGIQMQGNNNINIINNLIIGNSGRGVYFSSSSISDTSYPQFILNNTIAGNTLAGVEVTDKDQFVVMQNNIITNTNTANIVLWAAGNASLSSYHSYNLFYSSGGGTLSGITANSTELTSDPLYTGGGDYTLQASSPAKGAGFPGQILNVTGLGYASMGAFQVQAVASRGYIIGGN